MPTRTDPLPQSLLLHTVWSGLCPLIPIPFLDDWVLGQVRKRLVDEIAREHGTEIPTEERDVLALGIAPRVGCAAGCLGLGIKVSVSLVVKLVKKVFRKIVFVLMLKDCVDAASETFHRGWLIRRFLRDGGTPGLDSARATRAARAIRATTDVVDPRPVEKLLRRVFSDRRRVLRRTARQLTRDLRRGGSLEEEEAAAAPLVDRLDRDLREQRAYLEQLEVVFARFLEQEWPDAAPDATEA